MALKKTHSTSTICIRPFEKDPIYTYIIPAYVIYVVVSIMAQIFPKGHASKRKNRNTIQRYVIEMGAEV